MKTFLLIILDIYKIVLSPFLHRLGIGGEQVCRFKPTCSEYLKISIIKHGVLRGVSLGFRRLLSCNAWEIGANRFLKVLKS